MMGIGHEYRIGNKLPPKCGIRDGPEKLDRILTDGGREKDISG